MTCHRHFAKIGNFETHKKHHEGIIKRKKQKLKLSGRSKPGKQVDIHTSGDGNIVIYTRDTLSAVIVLRQ